MQPDNAYSVICDGYGLSEFNHISMLHYSAVTFGDNLFSSICWINWKEIHELKNRQNLMGLFQFMTLNSIYFVNWFENRIDPKPDCGLNYVGFP